MKLDGMSSKGVDINPNTQKKHNKKCYGTGKMTKTIKEKKTPRKTT